MPKDYLYEIWIRKGDAGGPFKFKDPEVEKNRAEVFAIAKALVDKGEVDEAVVLEKRPVQRFRKYLGEG